MSQTPYVTLKQLQEYIAKYPPKTDTERRKHGTDGTGTPNERDGYSAATGGTRVGTKAAATPAQIRAYMATVDPAIQGSPYPHGSGQTLIAADRLVVGFNLTIDEAWPYMVEYNQRCVPPWSDHELRRKMSEAVKTTKREPGYLLSEAMPEMVVKPAGTGEAATSEKHVLKNYFREEYEDDKGKTVSMAIGLPMEKILDKLQFITGGWPCRVGDQLFAPTDDNTDVIWLKDADMLFAWIETKLTRNDRYSVDWEGSSKCPTQNKFFKYCEQRCRNYKSVEVIPHQPPQDGVYYACPPIPSECDGHKYFDKFISFFAPSTPDDEDLLRAYFLSFVWGGPTSQRPLFIFQAEPGSPNLGRGAGKSTVAHMAGELFGGLLNFNGKERPVEIQNCLLSPQGRRRRAVLIDNVKSNKFSNGYLEGLITQGEIDGRQMYEGHGSRPNYLTFAMTFNDPQLSKDFAMRGFIVHMKYANHSHAWRASFSRFVEENRYRIWGDMMIVLRNPKPLMPDYKPTRFPEFDGDVLTCFRSPDSLQELVSLLKKRSEGTDADAKIGELVRDDIVELLRKQFGSHFDVDLNCVLIPTRELQPIVDSHSETGRVTIHKTSNKLRDYGIAELSYNDSDKPYRGWFWFGKNADRKRGYSTWR